MAGYIKIKQRNAQLEDVFLLSESISEYPTVKLADSNQL